MRSVVRQFVHPDLFEADVADTEISLALGQFHKLLGSRVVGFRAATLGNHADDAEVVACDGFGEVAQRFDGDSDDGFAVVLFVMLHTAVLATYGKDGDEYI